MLYGIGTDILKNNRLLCLTNPKDPFWINSFTEKEREQAQCRSNTLLFLTTRFAGKEAVFKAISQCGCDFKPQEIEIIDLDNGRPIVNILGSTLSALKAHQNGSVVIHLSLSYEDEYSVGMALALIE